MTTTTSGTGTEKETEKLRRVQTESRKRVPKPVGPISAAVKLQSQTTVQRSGTYDLESHLKASRAETRNLAKRARWTESRVPQRHVKHSGEKSGEKWNEKYMTLETMLGKGFLVLLQGNRGNGKTQMCVDLIWATISRSEDRDGEGCPVPVCRYVKAMDLFLDVKATYGDNTIHERDVIDEYERYDLLVIDEVGVRGETAWEDRLLTHLIDRRYDACKDTLMVSNLTIEALGASLGSSVMDRIAEAGGVVCCDWPSYRGA